MSEGFKSNDWINGAAARLDPFIEDCTERQKKCMGGVSFEF